VITVETDPSRNLLAIRYGGHVGASDVERCLGDVQTALVSLQSGFRLLTDLADLDSMEFSCAPYIDKVMDLCNDKGVATVVRVIPDSKKDIGFAVMSCFHYGRDVHIITCETADEATAALSR
jgi:hypothetical protein